MYREQTQHAPASVDPVYGEVLNNKLGLARLCSVRGRLGAPAITVTCIARVLGAMRQVTSEIGKKTNLTETGDDRMEATLTRCPKRGTVRC